MIEIGQASSLRYALNVEHGFLFFRDASEKLFRCCFTERLFNVIPRFHTFADIDAFDQVHTVGSACGRTDLIFL